MQAFWRRHSLTLILLAMLAVTLVVATVACWREFVTNEQAGQHHGFASGEFRAYWLMNLGMNFAPELMGLITAVLLTKRWRELGSAESK